MKMIITCQRNPALDRAGFFHHLRHVHWPLVNGFPDVRAALAGYVQNHALGPDSPEVAGLPWRIAGERDSVIELTFADPAALGHLASAPDYISHVRPDEARFNDLPNNIMVKTMPHDVFDAGHVGRCKRFDFLVRRADVGAQDFADALDRHGRDLALDPWYTGQIDRHLHNLPLSQGGAAGGQGFGGGAYDAVLEVWASSFAALVATAPRVADGLPVDAQASFSVFATEFVMIG